MIAKWIRKIIREIAGEKPSESPRDRYFREREAEFQARLARRKKNSQNRGV